MTKWTEHILKVGLVLLLLTGAFRLHGQKHSLWYIEPGIRYGRIIPNFKDASWLWQTDLYGLEVRVGRQTDGQKEWEQWFKYPSYGAVLRYSHFNRESIGDKIALFGFFNGNFIQRPGFTFFYQLGAGINFWTKKYDFYLNPENVFVGGHVSAHLDVTMGITARLSRHTDLVLAGNISHSSNGVLSLPNYGINGVTVKAGVRCRMFENYEPLRTIDTITQFTPINSLYFFVAPGIKQSRAEFNISKPDRPHHYFATTLEIGYMRQPHPKFRYGGGFDLFYNREVLTYLPQGSTHSKCILPATFAAFDITFSRLVLHTSTGFYLGRNYRFYKPYYERIGIQVFLGRNRNHFVGTSIKAHLFVADYIEWTYGFYFFNWYDKKARHLNNHRHFS